MADILKYRLPDGTQTQVIENTKTVNLPFTTASLDFSVILDDLAVEPDEVRGWFAEQPVLTSAQRSEEYGLTISLNQGETKTVVIKTVDAKSVSDLVSGRFNNFRDTFTITVIRATAPTVEDSDSSSPTFLTYPDSSATLTIINSSFTIQDSSVVFGVVDSNYIAARQRRDFSYLINTPTTLDSYGITQFDSDFDSALATKTTDNLTEGNNQYFTQSRARQSISATDAGGAGSLSYNNSTGVITYTGPSDSEIRSKLSASNDLTYNPNTGVFSIDVEVKYTKTNFDSDLSDANTGQLPEGSNLYFTNARARASVGADKGLVYSDGTGVFNIDSSHIINKVIYPNTIDSTRTIALIDSAYIQARDRFRDSAFVLATADSAHVQSKIPHAYVQALQIKYNTNDFTDSAFVNSRPISTFTNDAKYLDSTTGQNLINTAYIQSKQIQYNTSDFLDSTTVELVVDSSYVQSRQYNLTSTDSLSEGSTNLYFTNERVDDRVGALITGGVNVTATYDDAAGTLEIKVPFENIDDRVGNILTAGSGININYDDPNATITITNTLNTSDFPDSAFVTGLPVSTFTNDKNYLDSTYASALIDSAHIKAIVDSDYVQLIQADLQRDSSFISSIITGGALNMGANNIITTGKVLFANVYSQLSDLPNASTYHGMFAHVHATGKAYFAHAGAWIELANNSQLSNSSNWDTAFSWGDHSAAGYQLAATALDSAMVYRFTIDSSRTLQLVDSNVVLSKLHPNSFGKDSAVKLYYNNVKKFETTDSGAKITGDLTLETASATIRLGSLILQDSDGQLKIADSAGITTTVIRNVLDSALITQLIDGPYIQARQTLLDSDLALQLLLDSSEIIDLIDSAYINARVSSVDSDATLALIDSAHVQSKIPHAYVQSRQQKYNTSDFTDSAFVTGLPVSTFTNDANYLDSTTIQGVVDSAYVALRTTTGTDSATVLGLIDSNYIASRTIAVAQPQFVNYKYNADGNQTQFGGGVVDVNGQTVALSPGNFSVFLNGIKLLDSDFTANTSTNVITLSSGATLNDELVIQTIIGQNAVAGVSAIDSSYVQLRVPETYLSTIIDSDYVTARSGVVLDSASIASGVIVSTVDEAYVQARQQKYNTSDFTDSAFVTGLPISTFTNDANYLDSTTITGVVNNAYVRARQALIDSDLTKLLVDSAYIQLRDRFQDSSLVTSTIDSSYVQLRVPASYIQTNQTNFLDSSLTSQLIDSAYIALRTTTGTDSSTVISLIDSDYVGARVSGVVAPQFTDFRYKADSGQTLFSGADLGGASLNLRADNFNVYLNGIKLIDSDFTASVANNTITLTEGTDSGDDIVITTIEGDIVDTTNVVDSAYVQARQEGVNATFKDYKFVATANQTVFSGNDANGTALSFEANKFHVLLNGIRLDASDFTESADNNKITLAAGAAADDELIVSTIGTEKTTTLASITSTVDSAYVQARQADIFRDSAFITGIIDSAYIEPLLTPIHISSSNVGIGTSSPNHDLHLHKSTSDGNFLLITNSTTGSNSNDGAVIGLAADETLLIYHQENSDIRFGTASTERMRIKSGGNVGIGTIAPTQKLTVNAGSTDTAVAIFTGNDTNRGLKISTATANSQTDMLVVLEAPGQHSGSYEGEISFKTANTERVRVDKSGNVLIGKTSSDVGTAGHELLNYGRAVHTVNATTVQVLNRLGNDGDITIFQRDGTTVGSISQASSSTTYNTTSDERLKENIKPISDAVEKLMAMNPVNFTWKKYPDNPSQHGFIAQEMKKILPEAVTSSEEYMSMDYGRITPILVAALQNALKRIQELEEKK